MICLFFVFDAYDRHNYFFNWRQKLHLFSDIYFCIDFMMGMFREDILGTFLEVFVHALRIE